MRSLIFLAVTLFPILTIADDRPNVILVMADDMGYGQTGYYNHPILKTPNLDAMAANGIRFDRFYAGAPNCSPTRATVLTGRSNDRTGVHNHGYAINKQEQTISRAFQKAGYSTAHFGKWHLNGLRGPGAPILKHDAHHPGHLGFDYWLSVTNFFDMNPILSRNGDWEEHGGDSSEIVVNEALDYIRGENEKGNSVFIVIWYGTPHSPFMAYESDARPFSNLSPASRDHHAELVAMDRSIGHLRKELRDFGIAENTILWFNSDNGGLGNIKPGTVGDLRGFKNSVYEGGLRVPALIEWPAKIKPQISKYPACTMDIFPTLIDLAGLTKNSINKVTDGISLANVINTNQSRRPSPIGFRHTGRAAWLDNNYKLITLKLGSGEYQLYDLMIDPREQKDVLADQPDIANRMIKSFEAWNASVEESIAGADYRSGKVNPFPRPQQTNLMTLPEYQKHFKRWVKRPEFKPYIERELKRQEQLKTKSE
ncbi:MAG: N-acetylgalactosamine 6-sulfate sulfatase [Planctomycetaceae bacterium]|nr:N-acetylgalactosamine 6-sulfate sulfatase [Planctomycetaceae bacterium]